jgi:predicted DsbA family dithiol-disulfide isomerase
LFVDYVDPVSWILELRLKSMAPDSSPNWQSYPLEIRPPPQPLLHPDDEAWRARWDAALEEEEAGLLHLRRPWIVPWTRKAHELALFARESDSFEEIHNGLFRAYLSEGRDIGRVDVLVEIAGEAGLDPAETKAVLDVDRFREDVESIQMEARALGFQGPPALSMRGGRVLEGLPNMEQLRTFVGSQRANEP